MLKIKWIIGWLLLCPVVLFAQRADTPVTIQDQSIRIGKVLKLITKQTGLEFSFNSNLLNTKKLVAVDLELASVDQVLKELEQITNLKFSLVENQIILQLNNSSGPPQLNQLFTLSGFITDSESGESLIGATVYLKGTSTGTISNEFGYFSFQVPSGNQNLVYSYVGYATQEKTIQINKASSLDLDLKTASIELPDVIVGIPLKNSLVEREIGQMNIKPSVLTELPEFGGETGLIKGLQSIPGIKTHSDGSAFFYVRGGDKDQNLIIIDDAPIYNPAHLFGFYSIVIPDFTKSIQVFKADIPTYLGDRLSSIINIRTKDGNLKKWSFSGALNPLMTRLALEVPVVKDKAAIFVSLRNSNFDWIYKNNRPRLDLGFGDFNFKFNYKLNNKNRVFLTLISSNDELLNSTEGNASSSGINWGNLAATLRWNHIFSPKLFSNTTLYTGNYLYRLSIGANQWESGIGSLSFKTDFTHYSSSKWKSRFGLELQTVYINPGNLTLDTEINLFPATQTNFSRKRLLYYQAEIEVNSKTDLNIGVRLPAWESIGPIDYYTFDDNFNVQDTLSAGRSVYNTYVKVDPRISLRRQLTSSSFLKFSLGSYHQFLQIISNSTSPFSSLEIWLPAGPNIRPQAAWQGAVNYLKYFEQKQIEFTAAAYYKLMDNQIDYPEQPQIFLNPFREGELRFGTMRSYGLELMLKKESGKLNGWLNYNLSRTMKQTAAINEGNPYPAFQDRPHDFSLLLNFNAKPRFTISTYWTSYTGSPFSSPVSFYEFNDLTVPLFGEKNNDRLPSYHRMDIAFKWILNKSTTARYQHSLNFSIYNVLAHKNVLSINFNKITPEGEQPVVPLNEIGTEPLVATQRDLIRFFPSLTYKFKLQ